MLSRNKIYRKVETEKDAKKIFIFCEGDREVSYFRFFKGFSSNIDIVPVPNENGKSDPEKLLDNAKCQILGSDSEKPKLNFKEGFGDEVWFVIDTDRWNEGNKITNLKTDCKKQNRWFVAQSNPSFEIWLYFHFHSIYPSDNDIANYASFKEYVNDKISGGFNPNKHPILFQDAIINSEGNFEVQNDQPKYFSTEVFRLAKSILPFIKDVIDTCLVEPKFSGTAINLQ